MRGREILVGLAGLALAGCGDGGRVAAGRATAADLKLACAGSAAEVERRWPRLGPLEASLAEPVLVSPGPPADVHCVAFARRGRPVVYRLTVRCGALEPACWSVEGLMRVG